MSRRSEEYAAVDVFVTRARMLRPSFQLTEANVEAVAEVCARLDGLPLPVSLAASAIAILAPSVIAASFRDRLELPTGEPPDEGSTPSLAAALQWSWSCSRATSERFPRASPSFPGVHPGRRRSRVRRRRVRTSSPPWLLLEALRRFRALDDAWSVAVTATNLGWIAETTDLLCEAGRWYTESPRLWEAIGDYGLAPERTLEEEILGELSASMDGATCRGPEARLERSPWKTPASWPSRGHGPLEPTAPSRDPRRARHRLVSWSAPTRGVHRSASPR